jgi:hypothetical protein
MATEYPCWVYDPTGANPPMLVVNDDAYVALCTGPTPDSHLPSVNPTAPLPQLASVPQTPVSALTKTAGVTSASRSVAKFIKNPFRADRRI